MKKSSSASRKAKSPGKAGSKKSPAKTARKTPAGKNQSTGRSQKKKNGRPGKAVVETETPLCSVVGCGKPQVEEGYCKAHLKKAHEQEQVENAALNGTEGAGDDEGLPGLNMEQRLALLKKRHEIIKNEIASIHEALESEGDDEDMEIDPIEEGEGEEEGEGTEK